MPRAEAGPRGHWGARPAWRAAAVQLSSPLTFPILVREVANVACVTTQSARPREIVGRQYLRLRTMAAPTQEAEAKKGCAQ
jgi:hypothetical protein